MTDLTGVDSHGISMLMTYAGMRQAGMLGLQSRPGVVRETGGTAFLSGARHENPD